MTTPPAGPLVGLRVLDLTRVLAGPFATMVLADLGADVVKLEEPARGDETRGWGPPFRHGESAYFLSVNRGKRSVAVDLSCAAGRAVGQRLAAAADVVVENFRPGTAERLGLGYRPLAAANPRLVYASVSGYGQTGPCRDLPGYDVIAQALSGVMSVTGDPDGGPVKLGVSTADLGAGMWAVIGVLAALAERERTGRGSWVDVALLDGQLSWLTYLAAGYLTCGAVPRRLGTAHPTIVPYQGFPTRSGVLMLAVGSEALWARTLPVLGLTALADDPRFATNADRVRHRDELVHRIEAALAARSAEEWAGDLAAAGVPAAPILDVPAALAHPQVLDRGMVVRTDHPVAGPVRTVASPVRFAGDVPPGYGAPSTRPAPLLGEHTDEVLAELGMPADERRRLRRRGVVGGTTGP